MKKYVAVAVTLLSSVILGACGNASSPGASGEDGIEGIVSSFYRAGYDYEEIHTFVRDGAESGVIYEGQVFADPYREHVVISTFGDASSMASEIFYEEAGDKVSAEIIQKDGSTAKQVIGRKFPYGYGQEISFSEDEDGTLDGVAVEIWQGEYVVDVGKGYGLEEDLTAVVSQVYYILKEEQTLVRLDTDLTQVNQMTAVANAMTGSGLTREEAEESVDMDAQREQVVMKITNMGNPTEYVKE